MADLKHILTTLAVLSSGALVLSGCDKKGEGTEVPGGAGGDEKAEGSCGGETAEGGEAEGSCGGEKAEGEGGEEEAEGSCGGEKAEGGE